MTTAPKTAAPKIAARKAAARKAAAPRAAAPKTVAPVKKHRIFSVSVGSVYPLYVAKAEKKGRTRAEVDAIIRWLTGHTETSLGRALADGTTFEKFFAAAPRLNPARATVTGVVCGVRVETIEDPLMRELRILDKLVDELAKGRPMEKILRTQDGSG